MCIHQSYNCWKMWALKLSSLVNNNQKGSRFNHMNGETLYTNQCALAECHTHIQLHERQWTFIVGSNCLHWLEKNIIPLDSTCFVQGFWDRNHLPSGFQEIGGNNMSFPRLWPGNSYLPLRSCTTLDCIHFCVSCTKKVPLLRIQCLHCWTIDYILMKGWWSFPCSPYRGVSLY